MVQTLPLYSTRLQYSRPGIVLRAANANNDEKYADQDRANADQRHRFVTTADTYSLDLVV